jgi:hypothetical protein
MCSIKVGQVYAQVNVHEYLYVCMYVCMYVFVHNGRRREKGRGRGECTGWVRVAYLGSCSRFRDSL